MKFPGPRSLQRFRSLSRATSGSDRHVRSHTCEPLEVTQSLVIVHELQSLCKQTLVASHGRL